MKSQLGAALFACTLVTATALSPFSSSVGIFGATSALAAEQAIGAAVGKPLKEAQDLANAGKYQAALKKVQEASGISGKTAYESFVVDDFLLFLNVKLKDYAAAAEAGEAALATGEVPAKDRPQRLKTLAQLNYSVKSYGKAVAFALAFQKEAGTDPELRKLVVQSFYLQGDYVKAQAEAKSLVATVQAAGAKPDETVLQLWLSSAFKKSDKGGQREALTELVAFYPKPTYFGDLLNLVAADLGHSNRMSLEIFRLKLAAGMLKSSDDYMEMAQLAIQLGLPGEAESVMSKGFADGVFGGQNKGREQRLLAMAKSQAGQDEPTLGATAGTPDAKAALGEAYASYGKTDKAIALYKDALASNFAGAPLTRLHLGQAILAKGDHASARKIFDGIADAKIAPLANIWSLVAKG